MFFLWSNSPDNLCRICQYKFDYLQPPKVQDISSTLTKHVPETAKLTVAWQVDNKLIFPPEDKIPLVEKTKKKRLTATTPGVS